MARHFNKHAMYSAGTALFARAVKRIRGEDAPARYIIANRGVPANGVGGNISGTYDRTDYAVVHAQSVMRNPVVRGLPSDGEEPQELVNNGRDRYNGW